MGTCSPEQDNQTSSYSSSAESCSSQSHIILIKNITSSDKYAYGKHKKLLIPEGRMTKKGGKSQ